MTGTAVSTAPGAVAHACDDRQLRVRVEPLRRDHHGALIAHGLDRPVGSMGFYYEVATDPEYDGARARHINLSNRRVRWTLVAIGCTRTRSEAWRAVAAVLRDV